MEPLWLTLAEKGSMAAFAAALLFIHARHVNRLADAMEKISPVLAQLVEKLGSDKK